MGRTEAPAGVLRLDMDGCSLTFQGLREGAMRVWLQMGRPALWQVPVVVLVSAFLFNLGQGILRPMLPLYLHQVFAANYQMVTLIPVVFGLGKWVASLPTGYALDLLGRKHLMATGLLLIALCDVGSVLVVTYTVFLGFRALAGAGWAMFGTVATTITVDRPGRQRRGRAVSLLLMSETLGLLVGSNAGGWLYRSAGIGSPFMFEAACLLMAAVAVTWRGLPPAEPRSAAAVTPGERRLLGEVLHIPLVWLMSLTNAALIAIQTGVLVFLYPLYLVQRGGVSPEVVGLLIGLNVLGRLLGLWGGGHASGRWGRIPVLIPGLLVCGNLVA